MKEINSNDLRIILKDIEPILYTATPQQFIDKLCKATLNKEQIQINKFNGGDNFVITEALEILSNISSIIALVFSVYTYLKQESKNNGFKSDDLKKMVLKKTTAMKFTEEKIEEIIEATILYILENESNL